MNIIERLHQKGIHTFDDLNRNLLGLQAELTKKEREELAKEFEAQRELIVKWFGGEHNMELVKRKLLS
jgi:hypothetical protein